ncbi:MAG: futalosine hydrolase [Bacteroidota bacterium]|nr:futalosine hydrolase [Bacteroidota bacterium]
MKILIVVATKQEILEDNFSNHDILITGVGMVNTTFMLTKALDANSYDLVINMGIAGSFCDLINIGDVVEVNQDMFSEIGSESADKFLSPHEINLNIDASFISAKQTKLRSVRAITVNTIHGNKLSIKDIKQRLNPEIESMEGAAFMMVCQKFKIKCVQLRGISNLIEERNKENWNSSLAITNLNKEVNHFINSL